MHPIPSHPAALDLGHEGFAPPDGKHFPSCRNRHLWAWGYDLDSVTLGRGFSNGSHASLLHNGQWGVGCVGGVANQMVIFCDVGNVHGNQQEYSQEIVQGRYLVEDCAPMIDDPSGGHAVGVVRDCGNGHDGGVGVVRDCGNGHDGGTGVPSGGIGFVCGDEDCEDDAVNVLECSGLLPTQPKHPDDADLIPSCHGPSHHEDERDPHQVDLVYAIPVKHFINSCQTIC